MTAAAGVDPSYLQKGTRIGAYEVVDRLGRGGFGFLWKVRREGRLYALKAGSQRLAGLDAEERERYRDRLNREIAALATLHHPGIVRVHSFDWWPELEGGFPYLVMDFVDGRPLYEWREQAAPSPAQVCAVFEKLASAVAHMHALGIYHRDLKSDNVLVQPGGEPVVIDFGIARPRLARELTRAASVGTVTYYSPEYARYCDSAAFARGDPFEWKPTTDLHAVGYMLYTVLTGRRPFPREAAALQSEAALLIAIKTEIPEHPSERDPRLPRSLGDVAMALLEKEPEKRPQSAEEVEQRLRQAREAGADDAAWTDVVDAEAEPEAHVEPPGQAAPVVDLADVVPQHAGRAPGLDIGNADAGVPAGVQDAPRRALELPVAEERPPYDAGEPPAAGAPSSPGSDRMPSAVREARARLAESAPRRAPVRLAIGAGVAAAVAIALVVGSSAGEHERPARATVTEPPARQPGAPLQPALSDALEPRRPASSGAAPEGQQPTAAQIDEALTREFQRARLHPEGQPEFRAGGPRPSAAGPTRPRTQAPKPEAASNDPETTEAAAPDAPKQDPPWLMRSTRLVAATSTVPATAPKARGVPLGAHLRAKLLSNLDSRTIGNGPVEAVLTLPALVRGEVVLPARTMVYGTASESGGRFNVRFTRLRLPDDTEVEFEGLALARDDGKPGLAAARRIQGEPEQQAGLGSKIAKGTGNILLDTITGGIGQDVVRNAGQAALSHEKAAEPGSSWAILLDAGVVFDVWVERSF